MDIDLSAKEISVSAVNYKCMYVNLVGVDMLDIISQIGVQKILDEIGKNNVIDYFKIEEA